MEQWCIDNAANCIVAEDFQSTSYTKTGGSAGQNAAYLGDSTGAKPGHITDFADADASIWWTFGAGETFGSMVKISTDSAILNLLPDRNPTSVARFLRFVDDNENSSTRFGHTTMNLSGLKRLGMRWYSYHSPDYEWYGDGECLQGKIAHSSFGWFPTGGPFMTLTVHGATTDLYSFLDTDGWVWSGHATFSGFGGGDGPRPGSSYSTHNYRGVWTRHEIIVENPRSSDTGGYDFRYYVKDITNDGPEVEDIRFSAGCLDCMAGSQNFTWDSSIHPTDDMTSLHTEFYRYQGGLFCAGWQGWVYMVIAGWTTNAGQRILGAEEVEGGGGGGGGTILTLRPASMM